MKGWYGNEKGERLTQLKAIRHFCVECQGGHYQPWELSDGTVEPPYMPTKDVKDCPTTDCWLYPYRSGRTGRKKVAKTA